MKLGPYELNTIVQGDCLELMKSIPDKSVDCVITSPPYNMRTRIRNGKYTTRGQCDSGFSNKYRYFHDAFSIDEYYGFHLSCLREMLRISGLVFWNVSIVTGSKEAVFRIIGELRLYIKDMVIWDKGREQPAMHGDVINRSYEIILILCDPPSAGRAFNKKQFNRGEMSDVWKIKSDSVDIDGHSATFPIALPKTIIGGWLADADIILDPFAGSGTTLVAAEEMGRRYLGFELEPKYVAIANRRLDADKRQERLFTP